MQEARSDSFASGKIVVIVTVPRGDQRPCRTNRGDYFIRTSSGRRRASRHELLRLFQSKEALYYDEMPLLRAGLVDIDRYAFEHYIQCSDPLLTPQVPVPTSESKKAGFFRIFRARST